MELGLTNTLLAGDPRLVDHIVGEVKSQGIFDQFRKECIADVDTKPAYQNLRTRVEGSVNTFLGKQAWKPDLNKNQLRETLRKHIHEAPYLDTGVERIVDQVVNPKVYSVFMPQIEDVVYKFLGLEKPKPKERNGTCNLKDLLPKDLDPVSPESDKNSLKDVSLESMDGMDELITKDKEYAELPEEKKEETSEESKEKNKTMQSTHSQDASEEKMWEDTSKNLSKVDSSTNLNISMKSDEKAEEEEEDSPTFEPIDIMNLNESNNSNDSQLSGISELTSHRSRSPDFPNELSRDNCDYSNQDSQLSKVSSDSRLSIVTDYGSSNHASTPIQDIVKDECSKDKYSKDNFKAVRDFEHSKIKSSKSSFDLNRPKDSLQDLKETKDAKSTKNISSKENSRDATDSSVKDKYDHKSSRDRTRDSESSKTKSSKERSHSKDSKYQKEKDSDKRKGSNGSIKSEKYKSKKDKDRIESTRESTEKVKDSYETTKDNPIKVKDEIVKAKEDTTKDTDKKDASKEVKDLKDLYKEKIRELREKKELTEKEKLNKDSKDVKSDKESKDKKESSSKDKKSSKKDYKSSSSKSSSSSSHIESKVTPKPVDSKERRSESREKGRKDEKRPSRDTSRDRRYKSGLTKSESVDKMEKQETKKTAKSEKDDRSEKSESKRDAKSGAERSEKSKKDGKSQSKTSEKSESRRDGKYEAHSKEKKRKDEKKSKTKDDHSSLRKNSNDRRSTDRDGSNGSNGRGSQSNNPGAGGPGKSTGADLTKGSGHVSSSSIETSDSVEEAQMREPRPSSTETCQDASSRHSDATPCVEEDADSTGDETGPSAKRSHADEGRDGSGEMKIKKPKFAKNFHEAKKLMKIRKQMERRKTRETRTVEKPRQTTTRTEVESQSRTNDFDDLDKVPDDERVQIIEIPDEEYEEPYPEGPTNFTLEETSMIIVEGEPGIGNALQINSKLLTSKIATPVEATEWRTSNAIVGVPETGRKDEREAKNVEGLEESGRKASTEERRENESAARDETKSGTAEKQLEIKETKRDERTDDESVEGILKREEKVAEEAVETSKRPIVEKDAKETKRTKDMQDMKDMKDTKDAKERDVAVRIETSVVEASSSRHGDCLYFDADEKPTKFTSFMRLLETEETTSLEDMIEIMGGQIVSSSRPTRMAPPLPKRKHSSSPAGSPLADILLLSNSNNNNEGGRKGDEPDSPTTSENNTTTTTSTSSTTLPKKRKLTAKKQHQRAGSAGLCASQTLPNGESFVMPLSPESDVSATSEKAPSSAPAKEDKGRHRSNQRYSSDDLYKPRPLFASSSRRSRRSHQA